MKKNTSKNNDKLALDFGYRPHGFKDAEVDKKKKSSATKTSKKK